MRLARKLTLALAAAILLVMAGYAYLQTRREVVLFEADMQRSRWFGRGAAAAFQELWRTEGEARAIELLAAADRGNPEIKMDWRWLDSPPDDLGPALSEEDRQPLAGGQTVTLRRTEGNDVRRYILVPMSLPGHRPAALQFGESLKHQVTFVRTSRLALVVTALLIAAACSLVALGLGIWLVGRPIEQLRDKARRIAAGDFSGPIGLAQRDEIGELAAEIDTMTERISRGRAQLAAETEARIRAVELLRHADRLATVGRLASGIGHELGTPLSVISARAKMIVAEGAWTEDVPRNARIVAEQADRITSVVRQLLDFSRQQRAKLGPVSLQQIIARTLDLVSTAAADGGVNVIVEGTREPEIVQADPGQLEQALTNFVMNGIQAMPDGGPLTLSVVRRFARPAADSGAVEGEYVVVTIADHGTGISQEHLAHIFEPFFTTKGVGRGTGLGLSVAHGIVAEHGGWIEVETELGSGTEFRVFLRPAVATVRQRAETAS